MSKINKVYGAFFNGVSQQNPELALDNQCKEMINCMPDVVRGIKKRPPAVLTKHQDNTTNPQLADSYVFHSYDRGENNEEYLMMATLSTSTPIRVFNSAGTQMTVTYEAADATEIKNYLASSNLRGLTVQDRTWLFNKDATVSLNYAATSPLAATYDRYAYYWIKRGSGDRYNPFNYAVYIDGITFAVDPNKPASDVLDPPTGAEDSDVAAALLAAKINANANYTCIRLGSILKIYRTNGADFTFSSWDSWGNQASEGWKGSVNKITDLPKDMPFSGVYVEVTGDENNKFTNYFVKWNGSSWEECIDPKADRGQLSNMPLKMDRVSLVGDIATFHISKIDWDTPRVGNEENNPDPSFVGQHVQDMFFYKNRLGIASHDSVVLSEAAAYTNFYVTTALDTVDTDVVDVTVSTNQASNIYYAKPFNNSLYIFTKYAQYELVHDGAFAPSAVSIENVTNYPMKVDVEPVVMNNSLYFVSVSNNRQQLREYVKGDNLSVSGVDLNLATPTYMDKPIIKLIVDGVVGIVLACTNDGIVYVYSFKDDGQQRIQSAWSTWEFFPDVATTTFEWISLGNLVGIVYKTADIYTYHVLYLDDKNTNNRYDVTYDYATSANVNVAYKASILLPDYYPQITTVRTPLNKALIKRVVIEGDGAFNSDVYRKDYDVTYTKQHDLSLADGDFYVNSKVDNVDITIYDNSANDFTISSVVVESLYRPTSREMR
jgi:hypothetical protein